MMKKSHLLFITLCLIISTVWGCGSVTEFDDETVELVEPVGSKVNYAVAEKRDIVDCKVISGKVVPHVSEVYFQTSQNFLKYGVLPGSYVNKGEAVIYASTENIDKEIENLTDRMKQNETDYNEYVTETEKAIADLKHDYEMYEKIVHNFEVMPEADRAVYAGGNYESEYRKYKGYFSNTLASLQRNEQELKKRSELYKLDSNFDAGNLKKLKRSRTEVLANANISGTVVAVNFYDNNQYIEKNTAVAAVGDFDNLEIKSDHVYKSEIKKALDVYAIVNGERYEVIYKDFSAESSDADQNTDKASQFSTFIVNDPTGTVKAGDFATIVIVNNRKEGVLCVPKEAVSSESGSSYVYLYDGTSSEYTLVKKGISSGFYTEILSGLSEGDKVITDFNVTTKGTTKKLTKGTVSSTFSQTGYLFYSKTEWIKNPVEYGVTYVDEVLVKQYERVEKGQTIATVKITPDDLEIRRLERTIQRANEDLESLKKNNKDNNLDKAIKNKEDEIAEHNKNLAKMNSDKNVRKIVAPFSGIITSVNNYENGDIVRYNGNVARIAKEEDCFVAVEDESGQITVGNEAVITYKDANNVENKVVGEVVTVTSSALSGDLSTGYSLIKVAPEDLEKMSALNRGYGFWMRSRFSVTVKTRVMDNVVLVPRTAVKLSDGINYVIALDDNGVAKYINFVSGGSDNSNFWVVEGLTEGMTICLD